MANKHSWTDGWVLLAVLYAGRADEPADLASVIGAADHVNHAIPTRGELDRSLFRLIEDGWVRQEELAFAPTEKAEEMFSSRRGRRTLALKDLDFVREKIGLPKWTPAAGIPKAPDVPRVAGLTDAVLEEAVDEYLRRARGGRKG